MLQISPQNLSENKKNVNFCVFFLQKIMCPDLKNDIPDFPDHLIPIRFHHRVQGCRLHTHEFFGPSKWLINYLPESFYPKNSKNPQTSEASLDLTKLNFGKRISDSDSAHRNWGKTVENRRFGRELLTYIHCEIGFRNFLQKIKQNQYNYP